MEKKLSEAQATALSAVVAERDRVMRKYGEALEELLAAWAPGFKNPVLRPSPDGPVIVEGEEREVEDE